MIGCYILHFDRPVDGYPLTDKFADNIHYIGASRDVDARIRAHRKGKSGSKYTEAAKRQKIRFRVGYTVEVDKPFTLEKQLQKIAPLWCEVCQEESPSTLLCKYGPATAINWIPVSSSPSD